MIGEKRGLSTIVITLIIILLSLAAIGIVWVVFNGVIKSGTAGVDISAKCLSVDVSATAVVCSNGATNVLCTTTLERTGTGEDEIAGVKLIFKNEISGDSSSIINLDGNIPALDTKIDTDRDTGILIAVGVNKVEVTPFFEDSSGNEKICAQTNSFSF